MSRLDHPSFPRLLAAPRPVEATPGSVRPLPAHVEPGTHAPGIESVDAHNIGLAEARTDPGAPTYLVTGDGTSWWTHGGHWYAIHDTWPDVIEITTPLTREALNARMREVWG